MEDSSTQVFVKVSLLEAGDIVRGKRSCQERLHGFAIMGRSHRKPCGPGDCYGKVTANPSVCPLSQPIAIATRHDQVTSASISASFYQQVAKSAKSLRPEFWKIPEKQHF